MGRHKSEFPKKLKNYQVNTRMSKSKKEKLMAKLKDMNMTLSIFYGYQHYIKVSKCYSAPPLTPKTVIHVSTINRQGFVVDNNIYEISKLTKAIAVKIKNLILLLHKVELGNVVSMIV